MQNEEEMDVWIYIDENDAIVRTGLMKYYFPLLTTFMELSTMSALFTVDHTLPTAYDETISEDVANASQVSFII